MPLYQKTYGDSLLEAAQTPSTLETVVTITGDTTPTFTTGDIIAAKFSVNNAVGTDPGLTNLVSHWKLDEFSGDSGDTWIDSANGLNAEIFGSPDPIDGVVNNGFAFVEGDSEYGQVDYNTDIEFGTESFSICFWFRTSTAGNTGFIFHKSSNHDWFANEYGFHQTSTDLLDFSIGDSSTLNRASSTNIVDGEWHFAVGVVDRENQLQHLYVDNIVGDTYIGDVGDSDISTIGSVDNYGMSDLYIGRSSDLSGSDYFYDGDLDEIRLYSKALSEDERIYLYQNPPGFILGSQNPVGNANVNPLEVSGGGIVFNQLSSAPSTGSPYKGVLYLKDDKGLYYVDQEGTDVPIVSNEESWHPMTGDTGLWYQHKVAIGDSGSAHELEVTGVISVKGATGGLEINPRDETGDYFTFYNPTGDDLTLWNSSNGDLLTVTNDGNIGFNTDDIEAWSAAYRAIEFPSASIMYRHIPNNNDGMYMIQNAFFDGAWKYKDYGEAVMTRYVNGYFQVNVSGDTGDTGAVITWDQAIYVSNNGNVVIGDTDPVDKLVIVDANSQLRLVDSDDGSYVQFSMSNGQLAVRMGAELGDFFWIGDSGWIGVGVQTPAKLAHFKSGDTDPAIRLEKSGGDSGYGDVVYNSVAASIDFVIGP